MSLPGVDPSGADERQRFEAARRAVLERIEGACARVRREPGSVTLVAVSKKVDVERLVLAVAAGLTRLGENRVQEALVKAPSVPGVDWELVGPLQSNKARRAVETFTRIQTVDSMDLARRLDLLAAEVRPGQRYPVLLQVNVDEDPAKAGFQPGDLESALPELLDIANLDVGGLMTVGRMVTAPDGARRTFVALRELSARLRARWPALGGELSMGMSDDFEIAIEEGATIVRVGRALFGERARPGPADGAVSVA